MPAQIVKSAQYAPGQCLISGDYNGPLIDTQKQVRGYGRVYLSLKSLNAPLREAGWVPRAEVSEELERVEELAAETSELQDKAARWDEMVEVLSSRLPAPEPILKQVAVRSPDLVRENKSLRARVEELSDRLANIENSPQADPAPTGEGSASVEPDPASPPEESSATAEIHDGMSVDLEDLIGRTIPDIVAVVDGNPELIDPVLAHESLVASRDGRKVRSTLVTGLEGLRQ